MKKEEEGKGSRGKCSLTEKGRSFIREKRFMETLSERDRKAYEECMALLQGMSEEGLLEEACEVLERYAVEKTDSPAE